MTLTGTRGKRRIFEGGPQPVFEKIFDCAALNLMFLLGCLPLVTICGSFAALYYTHKKFIQEEQGNLTSTFFHSFKTNLAKGTALTLFFALLVFVTLTNRNISTDLDSGLFGLFLYCFYTFLAGLFALSAFYAACFLSRFEMGTLWIIKMAFYSVFRYFPLSLLFILCGVLSAFALDFSLLLLLALPAPLLFIISHFMEKILARHTPRTVRTVNEDSGGLV